MRRLWWIPVLAVLVVGGLWMALLRRADLRPGNEDLRPTPARQTIQATLYFVNADYVTTGDERLPKVKPVRRVLNISRLPHAEAVVRALMKKPESRGFSTALEGLTLLEVRTEGDTAFVNFSSTGLNGGSLEERLVIEQVVRSLTLLRGVRNVQFLVDGQKRETLMGHMDARSPISPDEL